MMTATPPPTRHNLITKFQPLLIIRPSCAPEQLLLKSFTTSPYCRRYRPSTMPARMERENSFIIWHGQDSIMQQFLAQYVLSRPRLRYRTACFS